ncbi:hypothetical protein Aph01nite_47860 [Acrocarpospora phusangensis]|uniref:Carrier domain-containing protein n=1 Tax=Acrocarpospora phusangensis TaxID=1070424 RepID=A0A919ULR1_9ACTN|nr:non-ribosomal peptide synthetase [Acrocarpospora phusangensis]GIH26476.1 hypothetical protein Aph01nite_47860 [Acrocarpospora phusangensis]
MSPTLTGMLAAQAARTPGAVAVRFEGAELSYAELHERADMLAACLAASGAGPGRVVAVRLDRSLELVVALVAVLKSGAAYLPVEPDAPADRVRDMLAEAAPVRVLDGDRVRELPAKTTPVGVEAAPVGVLGGRTVQPDPADPADAAYVIYTSGSTGRPKGVVVPHEAIVNRLRWMQAEYGLGPDDRVLQKTPAGFDVSVWEFFWPLVTGATLVLARPGGHREPAYLAQVIENERITTAHFVPSMLREFLTTGTAGRCGSLRRVICSGEALPVALRDRCHDLLPADLHNLYGPTEAAVDVTHWHCVPGRDPRSVPIGRPVWNTEAHVLDERLRPLPPGEVGELYLGGIQLARGYLGRPALTAERFVADPLGPPGARLYRTGDLANRREDGALEYVGRADRQVKIRGVRVEPGEIENVMAAHPEVAQAAVLMHEGRLIGYAAGAWREPELREHLRSRLPEQMVPALLVRVADFPLTANGKLDRSALPPPSPVRTGSGGPAGDARETLLTQVVGEVLGLTGVGAADGFIALGGDSISAMRVVGHARAAGLRLSTADVLAAGTITELAARACAADAETAGHDEGLGEVPLTPIMHWLRERGGPVDRFSQSMVLVTPAGARLERLTECLRQVVGAHGMLRLRTDPDTWTLHVPPPTPIEVRRVDATDARHPAIHPAPDRVTEGGHEPGSDQRDHIPPAALDRVTEGGHEPGSDQRDHIPPAALDWVTGGSHEPGSDGPGRSRLAELVREGLREARARLSPRDGVVLQAIWFDRGERQGRLALVVHHLAVDGVSWRILRSDLEAAWAGRSPTAVPTSFRTWSRVLAESALSRRVTGELDWWAGRSPAGAGPQPPAGGRFTVTLPGELGVALAGFAPAALGTDLHTVLLTALALAAPGEGLVDVEGHGREELREGLDLTRTVGWFTSVYPVRLPTVDPSDLTGAVAEVARELSLLPGKGLGYGLLRYLDPEGARLLGGRGAPRLGFNYLGRFATGGGTDWSLDPDHDVAMDDAGHDLDGGVGGESDGGGSAAARLPAAHAIEVDVVVHDRPHGPVLSATWTWAGSGSEAEARALAGRWRDMLAALAGRAAGLARDGRPDRDPADDTSTAGDRLHTEPADSGPTAGGRPSTGPADADQPMISLSRAELDRIHAELQKR